MNKRDFNVVGNEGTDNQELAKTRWETSSMVSRHSDRPTVQRT